MSQKIKIRRGLKSQLKAIGALDMGEMGFCTDSKEVFIGDGVSNILVGRTLSGTLGERPEAASKGRLFYVTSGSERGYMFMDDGAQWNKINSKALKDLLGSIDDIQDGSTYSRVKKTEVSDGRVTRISQGNIILTAQDINTHLTSSGMLHRVINDQGKSATELWSSQKIKNEIELAKRNIEYQDSVLNKNQEIPSDAPSVGQRHIVNGGKGVWHGMDNSIVEWDGSRWNIYTPKIGWTCYVEEESKQYSWNGEDWVITGGAPQEISVGKGLSGGGQSDTITVDLVAGSGIEVLDQGICVKTGAGMRIDNSKIVPDTDNFTLAVDGNGKIKFNLEFSDDQFTVGSDRKIKVKLIDGGTF